MFEDADKIRDRIKLRELPKAIRKQWEVRAVETLILNLLASLKEPLLAFAGEQEVERQMDPSQMSTPRDEEIKGMVPTPGQLKEIIRPDTFWAPSLAVFSDPMKAMSMIQQLAGLLVESDRCQGFAEIFKTAPNPTE